MGGSTETPLVLGVDGGGTKTIAWLASVDSCDTPLGRGAGGPANPHATDWDTAFRNLDGAIDDAFRDAGRERVPVAGACLAVAGVGRPAEERTLHEWAIGRGLAKRVVATNDALPVLAAASEEAQGIAVIAGTGALTFGRDRYGQTVRVGGWGWLVRDEGSAFDVGQAGLSAVLSAHDGRTPITRLTDAVFLAFNVDNLHDLLKSMYDSADPRAAIASLSQVVFDVAGNRDDTAIGIVRETANGIADQILFLRRKLVGPDESLPLIMSGSVLVRQQGLRDQVVGRVRSLGYHPPTVAVVDKPVFGAVKLARRELRDQRGVSEAAN